MRHSANNISLLMITFFLIWQPDATLAQVAPIDSPALFTGKDAQGAVTDALTKAGAGDDIRVSIDNARDEDIIAQASAPVSASADGVTLDKMRHRWQTTLLLKAGGKNIAPVKLEGRYEEMTRIPVLGRRVQAGEVIAEADIAWDRQPAEHLRRNTISDARDLIGKAPRHAIAQGRPIRSDEVAGPTIVSKGARVALIFTSRNLEIKTLGEALDSGGKGEVIRVRNLASKAIIQGTVESGDIVRVSTPGSDSAEAM